MMFYLKNYMITYNVMSLNAFNSYDNRESDGEEVFLTLSSEAFERM